MNHPGVCHLTGNRMCFVLWELSKVFVFQILSLVRVTVSMAQEAEAARRLSCDIASEQ